MRKNIGKILISMLGFGLFSPALVPVSAIAIENGTGTLVITTIDTSKKQIDAPISVDGVQQGAKRIIMNVAAGEHLVAFGSLDGYEILSPKGGTQSVQVKAWKYTFVKATYKKLLYYAGPPVTDSKGNVYNTQIIGTQTWMKENLRVTIYNELIDSLFFYSIPTTTPVTLDISAEISPKYQWAYKGDESKVDTYGRLYTWDAVNDPKGLCPTGWHVPTDNEWATLVAYLKGAKRAGGMMKEKGEKHWENPNAKATNGSGFTALPGGYRGSDGTFFNIGYAGIWWSATERDASNALARRVDYYSGGVTKASYGKGNGFSVRCIKD